MGKNLKNDTFCASTKNTPNKPSGRFALALVFALPALGGMSACTTEQVMHHGAVVSSDQLDLIPVGSSRDQVLLALGSPSTTGQFQNEVFYYISQTRKKRYTYQKARVTDQQVLSVYFNDTNTVDRVAKYGLQDGKVFDFISRTTSTGGKDYTFLTQLLTGRASPNAALGQSAQGIPGQ